MRLRLNLGPGLTEEFVRGKSSRRRRGSWTEHRTIGEVKGDLMSEKSTRERRGSQREVVEPLEIRGFTSLDHMTQLSRKGWLVEASTRGFLLEVDRKDLAPKVFRDSLSLQELEGDRVYLTIDAMNLEIGGTIARTKRLTKDRWQIAIDFSEDAPEYWRECLLELLPRPGGF